MKKMLIVSSALALMAAPSFAQDPAYDPATQQPGAGDQRGDQRNGLFDDWFDDGHSLEGTPVYTNDGERVGSVERVRGGAAADSYRDLTDGTTRDLDVSGLVVETGGFLGIGTREVEVEAGNAQRTSVDGEQRIVLDMSNAEFERLREHARDGDGWGTRDRDMDRGANQRWDGDTDAAARTDTQAGLQTGVQGQAGHHRGTFAEGDAFRDDHPLRDVAVYTNDGERVGSVERVRGGQDTDRFENLGDGSTADLNVEGLVVETGGFLGIGTREVDIQAGQAQRTSVDGEQRIILDMSNAEFERLREHARDRDTGMWNDQQRQDGARTDTQTRTQGQTGVQGQAGVQGQTGTQGQAGATPQTTTPGQTQRQARASGEVHGDVYTDGHHWVGTPVFSSDGERLGEVHKVRSMSDTAYARGGDTVAMTQADPDVDAVIVRTGGFLGLGRREVQVDVDRVELEMEGNQPRLVVDMTADEFGNQPDHERNRSRAGG